MAPRTQSHRLRYPLNAEQVENLDLMLQTLFEDMANNAIFPFTSAGDLLYFDGSLVQRLAIGSANQVLKTNGSTPSWGSVGGFTPGSVIFADAAGLLSQSNAFFFWDAVNKRLGIGTLAPGSPLSFGTAAGELIRLYDAGAGSYAIGIAAGELAISAGTGGVINFYVGGHRVTLIATFNGDGATFNNWVFSAFPSTISVSGSLLALSINDTMNCDGSGATACVAIGPKTTPFPAVGTRGLIFTDGVALASMGLNTAGEYADDVGGTVEMFAINEAGAVAQLTGLAVRKTADESVTNSTALQADDHLTVNLAAASVYAFEIQGFWTTAGATAGVKVQLNGTVGVGSLKATVFLVDDTANNFAQVARIAALAAAVGAAQTGDNSFEIRGTIVTTTAGTFRLEWAQNTADAVNATTVQTNSSFTLRKLAA